MNKSIIPNLFTSANLAFGVLGITLSATGNTFYAAICVLLSLVADGLDGRVARAPAYMLYMKELYGLGWVAYVPLLVFAVLGAFRLARFNIKTDEVHGYFEGLPIPAAGCLAATYVLCGVSVPQFVLVVCMIGVGILMVSEVKYPDFKGKSEIYINKLSYVLTAIFVIACLVYDWHTWAVMIFAGYVMFGLINGALNIVRK